MSNTVALRSGRDRLRYTMAFETSLMVMLIPAGALFFDKGWGEIGGLAILLTGKAVVVGLIYNWCVDKISAHYGRVSSERKTLGRILHAVGFEFFLTLTSLPIYVWLLDITVLQALAADVVVTSLVVGYTYVFTLAYDRLFPVVQPRAIRAAAD